MKRLLTLMMVLMLFCSTTLSVSAAEGNVTYNGDAHEFIFTPGSEYSPTDLFPNFKDVMPGDSISQNITVRNARASNVAIDIYMCSLGAQGDSKEFLSQLNLRVNKLTDTELFDATADRSAQLTNWVFLGRLYSGGEAELEVILDVPVTLDDKYSEEIGYLDWEFMVKEIPMEASDQKPSAGVTGEAPKTADSSNVVLYAAMIGCSGVVLFNGFMMRRKSTNEGGRR